MLKSKFKLIVIAIIAIILVAIFTNSVQSRSSATYEGLNWSTLNGKRYTYSINGNSIALAFDNVYCVNHSGQLPPGTCDLYPRGKIEIKGENATFYSVNPAQKSEFHKEGGCSGEFNNILAAILSDERKVLGYGANSSFYYESQLALYYYWDSWVEDAKADSYDIGIKKSDSLKNTKIFEPRRAGFGDAEDKDNNGADDLYYYSTTSAGTKEINVSKLMNDYKQYAREQKYNVTIYYFEGPNYKSLQRVILVERGPQEPKKITVKKEWIDGNDTSARPTEIKVQLLANGKEVKNKEGNLLRVTLNKDNNWYGEFTGVQQKDDSGNEIKYTVKEVDPPSGYKSTISEDASGEFTFKITNTEQTEVKVIKEWEHKEKVTTSPITVELYSNGKPTGKTITLDGVVDDKGEIEPWVGKFANLDKYNENGQIKYTVKEIKIDGYNANSTTITDENGNTVITIINTPTRDVNVEKKWEDNNNEEKSRPDSITVILYKNEKPTEQKIILDGKVDEIETEPWKAKFEDLNTYDSEGNIIKYEVKEESIEGYIDSYSTTVDEKGNLTIIITNSRDYAGYVEITGKVWLDEEDGKGNDIDGVFRGDKDRPLKGIIVRLKDINGELIKSTYTNEAGQFVTEIDGGNYGKTAEDGTYTIRVNYDNSPNVYKLYENEANVKEKLKTAYVEFEYDGLKYTTVANAATGENTSKAIEDEQLRNKIDNNYSTVTISTKSPDEWEDKNIVATTMNVISFETYEHKADIEREEIVEYCNGDGTHARTNPSAAWEQPTVASGHSCPNCAGEVKHEIDVTTILNVNLGLFEREQPDIAISSKLNKVTVEMRGQAYTYLYDPTTTSVETPEKLQAKFQNEGVYTYRRPVNPADIAYIKENGNDNETMKVFVTYEVEMLNQSTTLPVTVNSIINAYDANYEIVNIVKGNKEIKDNISTTSIYKQLDSNKVKESTLSNLDINIGPQEQTLSDDIISITYKVNPTRIATLFDNEAPLNHEVEIASYTTTYGEKTLYAEQRIHEKDEKDDDSNTVGRAGKPYAGYDIDSHLGNANIKLATDSNIDDKERLYSTDANGNVIEMKKVEDDTHFSPAFVLCKDESKTLAGTVWEDMDARDGDERVGDGQYNNTENVAKNVKVELYELITDNNGNTDEQLAKIYDEYAKVFKDAVVYSGDIITGADGSVYNYAFNGVVTGEYFVKYTYGDDVSELVNGATTIDGTTTINARNYKSTIITDGKIIEVMNKKYVDSDYDKIWHITHTDNYSVAVDNMLDRTSIADLQYSNFHKDEDNNIYIEPENMTAYTKPFKTLVEFEATGTSKVDINGDIEGVTNILSKLDFGIIERPREDLKVDKTITDFKITLSNGQVLTQGNPSEDTDIDYVKAMGFRIDNAQTKTLLAEIDAELIQGALLEITYKVTVTNNNEIDYDYGIADNYDDIVASQDVEGSYDKFITRSENAKYYYYGDSTGLDEMQATIEYIDYLDNDIVYEDEADWDKVENIKENLTDKNLISEELNTTLTENKYQVFGVSTTISRDNTTEPIYMSASRILGNKEEIKYDNNVEIIKIDGKTARTISGVEKESGKQVQKSYMPGNGVMTEQDASLVNTIITPPTGATNYIITYVITGLVGLIVLAVTVIFIKKKVLN